MKISMDKEYKYNDGTHARILCVNSPNKTYPVISLDQLGYIHHHDEEGITPYHDAGGFHLVEVLPFQKDEPVMVKDFGDDVWRRRYYSHSQDGNHYVFAHGTTSWSSRSSLAFPVCRYPTPEELGEQDE